MALSSPRQSSHSLKARTPKSSTGKEDEVFVKDASFILRSAIVRHGLSYKELALRLGDAGGESDRVLSTKIARGRFTFAFFIRVMRAIGQHHVDIAPLPKRPGLPK